jgi:hypothetical protein
MITRRKFLAALGVVPFAPTLLKDIRWEEKVVAPQYGGSVPTGIIMPFAGDHIPQGWVPCEGQTMSREQYPELYKVIEGMYGTPFRVPDLRARMHTHQVAYPPLEYLPTPKYIIKA